MGRFALTSGVQQKNVDYDGKHVRKHVLGESGRIEAEKTRAAYSLGMTSRMFRAPEVIDYSPADGQLVLERVPDIIPIRHALDASAEPSVLLRRVGTALRLVHDELQFPPGLRHALPEAWQLKGSRSVPLHGDFNTTNVQFSVRADEIVVLDWACTPLLGGVASYDTPYFDVVWYLHTLSLRSSVRLRVRHSLAQLSQAFLSGYYGDSVDAILADAPGLIAYMRNAGSLLDARHQSTARGVIRRELVRRRMQRFQRLVEHLARGLRQPMACNA